MPLQLFIVLVFGIACWLAIVVKRRSRFPAWSRVRFAGLRHKRHRKRRFGDSF